jgi:thiol-disulfide isomerase/thioredoxin
MKRFLQIAGPVYVSFAVIIAHLALAPAETTVTGRSSQPAAMEAPAQLLRADPRLDVTHTTTPDHKKDYFIQVWTTTWCGPCAVYKAVEVPALVKMGYNVKVRDYDVDRPRPPGIKAVPTTLLYYKGTLIKKQGYWRAVDINKFIEGRMSLKG